MSDLISKKALLEALKDSNLPDDWDTPYDITLDLVNSAPAVSQPQSVKDAFRMGILYISKKYELHRDEYFTGGDVADFLFMEEKELDDSDIESEIRKLIIEDK